MHRTVPLLTKVMCGLDVSGQGHGGPGPLVAFQSSAPPPVPFARDRRATLEVAHDIVPNTVAFAIRMVQCASEDAPCFAVGPKETLRQGLAVGGGPDDDVDPHHLRKYVRFRNEQKS